MQILKDEVRQNIMNAAVKTFKDQGYQKASMRTIASEAGMSPGNLYRYYKNKDAMFEALLQPLMDNFEKLKNEKKEFNFDMIDVNFLDHSVFIEQLVQARLEFRDELFILLLRADGSAYEGAKDGYRCFLEEKVSEFIARDIGGCVSLKGTMTVSAIAASMVEAFCLILEKSGSDRDFYTNILEYAELIMKPSIRNLLGIRDNKVQYRRISDEEIIDFFERHHCSGNPSGSESDGTVK